MNTEQIEQIINLVTNGLDNEALRLLAIHLRSAKAEDRLAELTFLKKIRG